MTLRTLARSAHPYLPSDGATYFRSLDGSDVKDWLKSQGYNVLLHYDTGRNGLAMTTCGLVVSTNGHVSLWK